jgi:hypothetical protein
MELTYAVKQELLTSAYAAFNRRDIDLVLSLMIPNVDWPNGMEGGRVHGHDQVRDYWRRQWTVLNPHVEPVRIEDDETGKFTQVLISMRNRLS